MQPGFDRALRAAQNLADFLITEFFLVVHHKTRPIVFSQFAERQFQFLADVELILLMP